MDNTKGNQNSTNMSFAGADIQALTYYHPINISFDTLEQRDDKYEFERSLYEPDRSYEMKKQEIEEEEPLVIEDTEDEKEEVLGERERSTLRRGMHRDVSFETTDDDTTVEPELSHDSQSLYFNTAKAESRRRKLRSQTPGAMNAEGTVDAPFEIVQDDAPSIKPGIVNPPVLESGVQNHDFDYYTPNVSVGLQGAQHNIAGSKAQNNKAAAANYNSTEDNSTWRTANSGKLEKEEKSLNNSSEKKGTLEKTKELSASAGETVATTNGLARSVGAARNQTVETVRTTGETGKTQDAPHTVDTETRSQASSHISSTHEGAVRGVGLPQPLSKSPTGRNGRGLKPRLPKSSSRHLVPSHENHSSRSTRSFGNASLSRYASMDVNTTLSILSGGETEHARQRINDVNTLPSSTSDHAAAKVLRSTSLMSGEYHRSEESDQKENGRKERENALIPEKRSIKTLPLEKRMWQSKEAPSASQDTSHGYLDSGALATQLRKPDQYSKRNIVDRTPSLEISKNARVVTDSSPRDHGASSKVNSRDKVNAERASLRLSEGKNKHVRITSGIIKGIVSIAGIFGGSGAPSGGTARIASSGNKGASTPRQSLANTRNQTTNGSTEQHHQEALKKDAEKQWRNHELSNIRLEKFKRGLMIAACVSIAGGTTYSTLRTQSLHLDYVPKMAQVSVYSEPNRQSEGDVMTQAAYGTMKSRFEAIKNKIMYGDNGGTETIAYTDVNSISDNPFDGAYWSGKKYHASKNQIRKITMICQRDQGSDPNGVVWEACLMLNVLETKKGLSKKSYGSSASGIIKLISKDRLFTRGRTSAKKVFSGKAGITYDPALGELVEKVVNDGIRILPLYVTRYVKPSKIRSGDHSISNVHDRYQYSKGDAFQTVYNKNTDYLFYGYPDGYAGSTDVFAYTETSQKKAKNLGYSDSKMILNKKQKSSDATAANGITDRMLLETIQNVINTAVEGNKKSGSEHWTYGKTSTKVPCDRQSGGHRINSESMVAKALYDLGFTDQPKNGIKTRLLGQYLTQRGWSESSGDVSAHKPGAIVMVGKNLDQVVTGSNDLVAAAEKVRQVIEGESGWIYSMRAHRKTVYSESKLGPGKRKVDCAAGVVWALRICGALPSGYFYGIKGKIGGIGKAGLERRGFTLIHINGEKTVSQAISDGTLKAGDIVLYQDLAHTNLYAGNGKWYDFGSAYNGGHHYDGLPMTKVYGDTVYGSHPISYIIRKPGSGGNGTSLGTELTGKNESVPGVKVFVVKSFDPVSWKMEVYEIEGKSYLSGKKSIPVTRTWNTSKKKFLAYNLISNSYDGTANLPKLKCRKATYTTASNKKKKLSKKEVKRIQNSGVDALYKKKRLTGTRYIEVEKEDVSINAETNETESYSYTTIEVDPDKPTESKMIELEMDKPILSVVYTDSQQGKQYSDGRHVVQYDEDAFFKSLLSVLTAGYGNGDATARGQYDTNGKVITYPVENDKGKVVEKGNRRNAGRKSKKRKTQKTDQDVNTLITRIKDGKTRRSVRTKKLKGTSRYWNDYYTVTKREYLEYACDLLDAAITKGVFKNGTFYTVSYKEVKDKDETTTWEADDGAMVICQEHYHIEASIKLYVGCDPERTIKKSKYQDKSKWTPSQAALALYYFTLDPDEFKDAFRLHDVTFKVEKEEEEEEDGDGSALPPVARYIYRYLHKKGLSDVCIAGILGNMTVETDGGRVEKINPEAEQVPGSSNMGIGLIQWTGTRHTALVNYAKSKGKSWKDLGIQTEYLWKEIDGQVSTGWSNAVKSAFMKCKTPQEACMFFFKYSELNVPFPTSDAGAKSRYDFKKFHYYDQREPAAVEIYNLIRSSGKSSDSGVSGVKGAVKKYLSWATRYANDNRHIYVYGACDENGNADCSGFVWLALKHAGLLKGADAAARFTTYSMPEVLARSGFKKVAGFDGRSTSSLKKGDILLRSRGSDQHTEIYYGNNRVVGAHRSMPDNPAASISITGYSGYWTSAWRYSK